MIYWSIVFFVMALVSGISGASMPPSPASGIAWILFSLGALLGGIFLEFHQRVRVAPE